MNLLYIESALVIRRSFFSEDKRSSRRIGKGRKRSIAVVYAPFAVAKRKPEKNSGLYGIRTLDLCDTGTALYQFKAN